MGLSSSVLELVKNVGFASPTPVQAQAIPIALKGKDLIASARTGSGKTLAFCLPMIQALMARKGTYGLILSPTREIALQTQQAIEDFGGPLGVVSVPLIGGTDVKADEAAIARGPQILVGTPGRICDHLERGNLWLEFIEILVLDEADRMLDMGFAKELSRIVDETPKSRQTLLLSATFPPSIDRLAQKILRNPERVAIGKTSAAPDTVDQEFLWVNEKSKQRELIRLLQRESGTFIVFTKTKDEATRLWRSIHSAGICDSTYISSNKLQIHREEALQGFKDGKYRVLVATDVAGRGIHVENVGFVVNYDLPREPEDYIHRIGRTGRQQARGKAISFVTAKDRALVAQIEQLLGKRVPERFSREFQGEPSPSHRSPGRSRGGRIEGGDRSASSLSRRAGASAKGRRAPARSREDIPRSRPSESPGDFDRRRGGGNSRPPFETRRNLEVRRDNEEARTAVHSDGDYDRHGHRRSRGRRDTDHDSRHEFSPRSPSRGERDRGPDKYRRPPVNDSMRGRSHSSSSDPADYLPSREPEGPEYIELSAHRDDFRADHARGRRRNSSPNRSEGSRFRDERRQRGPASPRRAERREGASEGERFSRPERDSSRSHRSPSRPLGRSEKQHDDRRPTRQMNSHSSRDRLREEQQFVRDVLRDRAPLASNSDRALQDRDDDSERVRRAAFYFDKPRRDREGRRGSRSGSQNRGRTRNNSGGRGSARRRSSHNSR